jgi:hypothetical protein
MHGVIQKPRSIITATLLLVVGALLFGVLSPKANAATAYCSGRTQVGCSMAVSQVPCTNLSSCDLITEYLDPLIKLLTALVGVVVVISIIIGGIQYSSSGGDPSKAGAAKERIRNAIIALVAFILLYGTLNFLIPGGLGAG